MTNKLQKNNVIIGLFLILVFSVSCEEENVRVLPIVGDRDVEYKMVDGVEVADTVYHHVPEFTYLNQDSIEVASKELKDRIWITDFFFTHCPTICPPMTSQMKRLNDNTVDLKDEIYYLSFSIDPDRDTPTRLKEYRSTYGITTNNWHFFTGDEEATHLLAKEFFNGAERNEDIDGGFGHTSYFALVDKEGLVRGIYDGTDAVQVDKLEVDLRKLLKHEYNIEGTK